MSLKKVIEEIGKGLPSPLYFFYGTGFLVDEMAESAVRRIFPSGPDDFSFTVFHASGAAPAEIVSVADTLPFMSPRRMVIVREAEAFRAADKKPFERYLANPSPSTCLLFLTGVFDKRSAFLKLVMSSACKSFEITLSERDIPAWAGRRASELGVRLTSDALALLLELIGPEPAILAREIEKLSLLGVKEIGVEQVEQGVGGMREYTPFAIVAELGKGNIERALRITKALFESGQEAVSILGVIAWHYRQIYNRAQNKKGFREIFEALHDTDVQLKSSGKPENLLIESLLFKLMALRLY
ncbi:MAG: DNA polymerase III subunit delta [Nitrospirae bacterium]|nr:DNA polymerase III subunit delta [Nitrospirota bacterium]